MAEQDVLKTPHGNISFPAFLPDATQGVVRAVDAADLEACGVAAVVMNTFHLMQRPGSSTVEALGGLHRMAAWLRPIVTDSGGFQAYSLIRQDPRLGSLSERGIAFQPKGAPRKFSLTPAKSVQLQLAYGADVVICLDDCTHAEAPHAEQERSVRRTVAWARQGKREFERIVAQKGLGEGARPLLFAVIQGGTSQTLRRACAEELLAIGFDGFGYGGWPLDARGHLLLDTIAYTRELVPAHLPMHALGIGHPEHVARCYRLGYQLFDSALPTRDARHGRLYAHVVPGPMDTIYVADNKHIKAREPIDPACDCLACRRYSLGYLHHLFKIGDACYLRLATLHNLRAMVRLTDHLRMQPPLRWDGTRTGAENAE
ncbi:MAG: tRNA-ribosyltransferase family protein [Anaerolineae bacterium]